ncbi:L-rhamnose mutarotase [Rhodococcus sp. 14-1411-2a]|uniref:L-rhamnose mutarotase n=1 Tax=Rhodococcus sp. 14-1411-2a TaxID=2023151 RepID=UPI000B9BCDC5|nr:L-rhamnose mutarotase [Rhodococcus sp. 14-1411-2a]OZF52682.1 hypothetical protein CH291_02555 [Rhodococcus sp. 14-1411-2a]
MRVAVHTRIRPDSIEDYEAAHREVPAELIAAIRAAGVKSWSIWRSGIDLFHTIDCDDYGHLLAALRDLPVNVAWQARMGTLLETSHDYSSDGSDATLPLVWELDASEGD